MSVYTSFIRGGNKHHSISFIIAAQTAQCTQCSDRGQGDTGHLSSGDS